MSRYSFGRFSTSFLAGMMLVGVAVAASPVRLGVLECVVSDENKTLIKTKIVLKCEFTGVEGGAKRNYEGTIDRIGLAIGNIGSKKLFWIVGTLGDPKNVKLDGTYIGGAAGVSAGAGAGVNYLTGGFNKKISLQPYSVQGRKGLGAELGGQSLQLKEIAQTN
jgi:hypothetical protein